MTDKKAKIITAALSVIVFGTVALLGSGAIPKPVPVPAIVFSFPKCIAIINATCSLVLIASFLAIKNRKISVHKFFNYTAMILSAVFLVLYIATHFFIPDTRFGDTDHNGIVDEAEKAAAGGRYIYYVILLSHIFLAAIVLPLVLMSFHYGRTNSLAKHKKLTRYSFPIWLYVTITGVVVYLMIQPYYAFNN
jgi:putative membrane protein